MSTHIIKSQSLFQKLAAKRRGNRVRVTVEVTPLNGATLQEVSTLVRDLLAESGSDESSDTFTEVELVNAVENDSKAA